VPTNGQPIGQLRISVELEFALARRALDGRLVFAFRARAQ